MNVRIPPTPYFTPGMKIGLFGGSFNPPHAGHVLVSAIALRRLGLDRIWWLATPGNPLKSVDALAPLAERMAAARRLIRDPQIVVSGLEADIGVRYTYDLIAYLKRRCPGVYFVWIMGADNLAQFHQWQKWRAIAQLVPIAVIDRPGATLRAANAPAAHGLRIWRMPENRAHQLVVTAPPALIFLHERRLAISSTQMRGQKNQKACG